MSNTVMSSTHFLIAKIILRPDAEEWLSLFFDLLDSNGASVKEIRASYALGRAVTKCRGFG